MSKVRGRWLGRRGDRPIVVSGYDIGMVVTVPRRGRRMKAY